MRTWDDIHPSGELGAGARRRLTDIGIRGVRVTALPRDPRDRLLQRIRAVAAVIPDDVVIVGWSAALLHGVSLGFVDGSDGRGGQLAVEVGVPRESGWHGRSGVRVRRVDIPSNQLTVIGGVPCTGGPRTALDTARWCRTPGRSLAMLDAAARYDLTTRDEFARFLTPMGGLHGLPRVRGLAPWMSPRAESPQESVLRHLWLAGGLPALAVNPRVFGERGRFVARPDLFDEEAAIALEYQSLEHHAGVDESGRFAELARVGIHTVPVWREDLKDPAALVRHLRELRQERLDQPRDRAFHLVDVDRVGPGAAT